MHLNDHTPHPHHDAGSIPDRGPNLSRDPAAAPGGASGPGRLSWPLITGLSALALLWPLAELTGMPRGFGRAAVVILVTAVCWIGVIGFGRFARPVLTLTLVGIGSGLLSHVLAYVVGGGPTAPLWTLPVSLGMQAGWGAIAGLLAWAVQAMPTTRAAGRAR